MISMTHTPRGFTLLISIILASVALSIGLALLDISYKQSILASSSKQSQISFYNADAALECALFWDQKQDLFNDNPFSVVDGDVTCNEMPVDFSQLRDGSAPTMTVFTIPCEDGGTAAQVTVYKNNPGEHLNVIYATGYNTCDTENARRIERGLKVTY